MDNFLQAFGMAHDQAMNEVRMGAQLQQMREVAEERRMNMWKMAQEMETYSRQQNYLKGLEPQTVTENVQQRVPNAAPPSDFTEPVDEYQNVQQQRQVLSPDAQSIQDNYGSHMLGALRAGAIKMSDLPKMEPKNLENILADKVRKGEMTLTDAMTLKQKKEKPNKMVGWDKGGKAIYESQMDGKLYYDNGAEYEGGQYQPKAQPTPLNLMIPGYQTSGGQPVTYNTRQPGGGIQNTLQKTPSESDMAAARTTAAIDTVIDETKKAFDNAEKSLPKTATERIAGYPVRVGKVTAQTDENLVLADSLSSGFLAKFARAAGEVGVLTEGDIKRAKKLVPTIHDTKAIRNGKLKQAKELYNEIYQRGRRTGQSNIIGNAPDSNSPPFDMTVPQGADVNQAAKSLAKPTGKYRIIKVR